MTRPRYRVVVTVRRGDQDPYTYTFAESTRRPARTVNAAAFDVAENITRGWRYSADIFHIGRRATVRSWPVRAYARAVPVAENGA